MIAIKFTTDSKRYGQTWHFADLTAAKQGVRKVCSKDLDVEFSAVEFHGYTRAWEVTCGDTVIAFAFQLRAQGSRE